MTSQANMLKTTVHLTPQQRQKLALIQQFDGGDMAYHIRAAFDQYLDKRLEFHLILKKAEKFEKLLLGLEGKPDDTT